MNTRAFTVTAACVVLLWLLIPELPHQWQALRQAKDFEPAMLAVVWICLVAVLGWLTLVGAAAAIDPHWARRLGPAWVTAAILGVAVAAPAQANTHVLDGLTLPDRPTTSQPQPPPQTAPPTQTEPSRSVTITVRPGDTLWGIAKERLPTPASNAAVARAVDRWAHVNRAVIGNNPDLIEPGQELNPPKEPS